MSPSPPFVGGYVAPDGTTALWFRTDVQDLGPHCACCGDPEHLQERTLSLGEERGDARYRFCSRCVRHERLVTLATLAGLLVGVGALWAGFQALPDWASEFFFEGWSRRPGKMLAITLAAVPILGTLALTFLTLTATVVGSAATSLLIFVRLGPSARCTTSGEDPVELEPEEDPEEEDEEKDTEEREHARRLRAEAGPTGCGLRLADAELASALLAEHGLAWEDLPGASEERRTLRRKDHHLSLVLVLLALAGAFLVFDPTGADEGTAIMVLEQIEASQWTAVDDLLRDEDGDGKGEFVDLEALIEVDGLGGLDLSDGTHAGYRFEVQVSSTPDEAEASFEAYAFPLSPGWTGRRSFMVDQDGGVRPLDE
jgi:hypothetical protein